MMLYVKDMAPGFAAASRLKDAGKSASDAFPVAFPGCKYVKSTFSEHKTAWERAAEVPGEQDWWIAQGTKDSGKWALFYKKWNKRSARKRS